MFKTNRKFLYDSLEDAERRLLNTVVLYKGDPVYIERIRGLSSNQIADVILLPTGKTAAIETQLDLSSFEVLDLPPLGYVNLANYAHYLVRQPIRAVRQGLCAQNVNISANPDGGTPNWDRLMRTQGLVDMFKNKYPTFDSVFDEIIKSDDAKKKAFSKRYALAIDDMESITLEYRGINIARANNPKKYGPRFTLPKKYEYLTEELTENAIRTE